MLRRNFDYVVVDTSPPSTSRRSRRSTRPTSAAGHHARRADAEERQGRRRDAGPAQLPRARRHLVLNRADDKVGLTADKVESTLGMTIDAPIPTSPQVANATNSGEPIVSAQPQAPGQPAPRLAARWPASRRSAAAAARGQPLADRGDRNAPYVQEAQARHEQPARSPRRGRPRAVRSSDGPEAMSSLADRARRPPPATAARTGRRRAQRPPSRRATRRRPRRTPEGGRHARRSDANDHFRSSRRRCTTGCSSSSARSCTTPS